ncbi:MAG: hypothetical protein COX19_09560 [Desulfobacterales bacterium CG23_combo_of_CG06-09_8_20_14_all_51_8]|nr:MAG: hypothetical protein COX19_09560 [Desulfobacterales bacterium CG23_combo_of_CG06-09_8_20_14_all_51_8]
MENHQRLSGILFALMICLFFGACGEKKEGKAIVSETEFLLEHDGTYTFSLNAKGKVKNIGSVDLKNIVLTGHCRSCDETMISGKWFATQEVKTHEQKDMIGYLAAGAEEGFTFKDIAYYYTKQGEKPLEFPEKLEVIIESFETVE